MKSFSLLAALPIALLTLPAVAQEASPEPEKLGPGKTHWAATYAEARERAARENKLVYVEFVKDECGNCDRMHVLIYPAIQFEMTLLRMAPVQLKLTTREATELEGRYKIAEAPAVLILSPGGALIFRLEGFDTAQAFYAHIHRSLADWDKLNARILHELETMDDPKEALSIGADLYRRSDPEEAIPRLQRAADSPKADPETRDTALAALASAQYDLGKISESRTTVDRLLRTGTDEDLREKAELFRAQIAARERDTKDAEKRLNLFLKEHPDSKHSAEARKFLDSLHASEQKPPAASNR